MVLTFIVSAVPSSIDPQIARPFIIYLNSEVPVGKVTGKQHNYSSSSMLLYSTVDMYPKSPCAVTVVVSRQICWPATVIVPPVVVVVSLPPSPHHHWTTLARESARSIER